MSYSYGDEDMQPAGGPDDLASALAGREDGSFGWSGQSGAHDHADAAPERPAINARTVIEDPQPATLLTALGSGSTRPPPTERAHDPSMHAPPPHSGRRSDVANKASSTTSEFTKRKNWAHRIIEELQDFLHVLSPSGDVLFASPSIEDLAGWSADELIGQPMSRYIHPNDAQNYARDFAQSIKDNQPVTLYCRVRRKPQAEDEKDGGYVVFEIAGRPYSGPAAYAALAAAGVDGYSLEGMEQQTTPENDENSMDQDGVSKSGRSAQVFIATGRSYPSKNAEMIDSFLDIKVENERLRQELNQLYAEIEASDDLTGRGGAPSSTGVSSALGQATLGSPVTNRFPGTALPPDLANTPTGVIPTAALVPAPHGGPNQTYGALGIAVKPPSSYGTDGDKKRKQKQRDEDGEFVCRDCGTVDSPEWRKGPLGPKTLCNACGLRWAKKCKLSKNSANAQPAAAPVQPVATPTPAIPQDAF